MNEPLVSICIPTYNRFEGLRQSLDCFTKQTYRNLEILVSDNFSSHDPSAMVREYAKEDGRIRYYRQSQNIGMTLNGHFLWTRATGQYFVLGSDDDWWSPDFVSELVELLQKESGAVCAFCDFEEIDIHGKKIISTMRFAKTLERFGMNVRTYPDHLPLLMEFSNRNTEGRLLSFILQKEYDGKANVHRSLCDRQVFLESIAQLRSLDLEECWAFDQLLAFTILTRGHLALSQQVLFKCTVGNQKSYKSPRSRLRYLDGYVRIMSSCLGPKEFDTLKRAVNYRYLDWRVGFFQEYLKLLIVFLSKRLLTKENSHSSRLEQLRSLLKTGDHNSVVLSTQQSFNKRVDLAPSPLPGDAIRKYMIGSWRKLVLAIEILRIVIFAVRNPHPHA
jgi:glycosyltransferase involved in cell wall biosynthesis